MNEDGKLWALLERSLRPSPPPFFAGKVMRQIEAANGRPSWLAHALRWLAPAAVAAMAVFALLPRASTPAPAEEDTLTTLDIVEMVSPDDYVLLTSAGGLEDDDLLTSEL
ncbi:MAG: hypothetical protein JHC52_11175 [Chthoniobacterales bacterium]|jgi:hypothetical protein|nr:hypothetical protein [Chthoniobacterales bacterium]